MIFEMGHLLERKMVTYKKKMGHLSMLGACHWLNGGTYHGKRGDFGIHNFPLLLIKADVLPRER